MAVRPERAPTRDGAIARPRTTAFRAADQSAGGCFRQLSPAEVPGRRQCGTDFRHVGGNPAGPRVEMWCIRPQAALDQSIDAIVADLSAGPFIFNLGHGVLPQTPLERVERLVERIVAGGLLMLSHRRSFPLCIMPQPRTGCSC